MTSCIGEKNNVCNLKPKIITVNFEDQFRSAQYWFRYYSNNAIIIAVSLLQWLDMVENVSLNKHHIFFWLDSTEDGKIHNTFVGTLTADPASVASGQIDDIGSWRSAFHQSMTKLNSSGIDFLSNRAHN